jgi:hypothetical protein
MKKILLIAALIVSSAFCFAQELIKDIPLPEGYSRIKYDEGCFGEWLRSRKLKPAKTKIYKYTGEEIENQISHFAVLDIEILSNAQECADAVMMLRSDYLYEKGMHDKISFNFLSGFNAPYSKWREGNYINVEGGVNASWVGTERDQTTFESYRKYLKTVFNYANSLSLQKQMKKIGSINDVRIGDVFIHGGTPGHVVFVIDAAENVNTGEKIFMLVQSFMPAQSIHILKNRNDDSLSPWYSASSQKIETPTWIPFTKNDHYRFGE